MALQKCPRCELNYIHEGEKYCQVCRRDMRGEDDSHEVELCNVCGERPSAPGEDMCVLCLREMRRTEGFVSDPADPGADAEAAIDPLAPSDIEEMEMEIDVEEEIPSGELGEIDRELSMDDEEEIVPESLEQLEEEELSGDEEEDG